MNAAHRRKIGNLDMPSSLHFFTKTPTKRLEAYEPSANILTIPPNRAKQKNKNLSAIKSCLGTG
jgi:hypothetical protein